MKRKILFAGVLMLALVVTGLLSQQPRRLRPGSALRTEGAVLRGVWYWQNTMPAAIFGSDAVLPSVVTFHDDGAAVCSDGIAFGGLPPAFNPFTCTPFYGEWERTGPLKFEATLLALRFDRVTGLLDGVARARVKFAYAANFNHIAGTIRLDFLCSTAGPLKVPDPLSPDANWQPSVMGELAFHAARLSSASH